MIYLACNEKCVPCVWRNNPPEKKNLQLSHFLILESLSKWLTVRYPDCPTDPSTDLLAYWPFWPTDLDWMTDWLLHWQMGLCVTLLQTHRLQLIRSLNGRQEGCVCIEWSRSQLTIQDHCLHETGTIDTPSFKWPQIINPNLDRPKKNALQDVKWHIELLADGIWMTL